MLWLLVANHAQRMEDDPGLLGVELWVNRTIEHARDARLYNISGLIGIHWRTLEVIFVTILVG